MFRPWQTLPFEDPPWRQRIEKHLKYDIEATKEAPLEDFLSSTLDGKQPMSDTQDKADIAKTTSTADKEELSMTPKDPEGDLATVLDRRTQSTVSEHDYRREYYEVQDEYTYDL